MAKIIGVRFRRAGKIYYFSPRDLEITAGQNVIVETVRGVEYGHVCIGAREVSDESVVQPLKEVLRVATPEDDEREEQNRAKEGGSVDLAYDTGATETTEAIQKRIKCKKDYIVKLLKKQGKYTVELSMQATVTAQLMVRTEILAEEIFSDGHKAVNVEISREGNSRESISPKEKLYLALTTQTQRALKALGMNTDSKDRPSSGDDEFSKFMKEFSNDSDD